MAVVDRNLLYSRLRLQVQHHSSTSSLCSISRDCPTSHDISFALVLDSSLIHVTSILWWATSLLAWLFKYNCGPLTSVPSPFYVWHLEHVSRPPIPVLSKGTVCSGPQRASSDNFITLYTKASRGKSPAHFYLKLMSSCQILQLFLEKSSRILFSL